MSWHAEASKPTPTRKFPGRNYLERHRAGESEIGPMSTPTTVLTEMHTRVLAKIYTKCPRKLTFSVLSSMKAPTKVLMRVLTENLTVLTKIYTKWFGRGSLGLCSHVPPLCLSRGYKFVRFCKRAVLANVPSSLFLGSGSIRNQSFLLLGWQCREKGKTFWRKFRNRGTSAKTTILETTLLRTPGTLPTRHF